MLVRPGIVLYGEEHPSAEIISPIITSDLRLGPDLLLIMGTSLKVHGLKKVVREFAKSVHAKKIGKVVFINATAPAESIWRDVIDYWVDMDCDEFVEDLRKHRSDLWQKQTSLSLTTVKKRSAKPEAKRSKTGPSTEGEEKENDPVFPWTPSEKQSKKANAIIPAGFSTPRRTAGLKNMSSPLGESVSSPSRSPTKSVRGAIAASRAGESLVVDSTKAPPSKYRGSGIPIFEDENDDTNDNHGSSSLIGHVRVEIPNTPSRTGAKRKRGLT